MLNSFRRKASLRFGRNPVTTHSKGVRPLLWLDSFLDTFERRIGAGELSFTRTSEALLVKSKPPSVLMGVNAPRDWNGRLIEDEETSVVTHNTNHNDDWTAEAGLAASTDTDVNLFDGKSVKLVSE